MQRDIIHNRERMEYPSFEPGQRVLVKLSKSTTEVAKVKHSPGNEKLTVSLYNGRLIDISPDQIIKSFGW